ncbi:MAG TPA: helix-hairpin-helix domain-containing protein, partial [Saprospiraceae bacterium]|nr:helix-hairpin-helix domain-containing protein [Saprospiraceae bacterium]
MLFFKKTPTNQEIAKVMDDIAGLLEIQHANPFRVKAYRTGAKYVRERAQPVADLVKSGDGEALQTLPGIGESLAAVIEEYVKTGKSKLLRRLKGKTAPEDLFEHVPGIGPELAGRIVKELDIKTLEELEQAAHDGRLAKVEGFGRRRVEAIQIGLAGLLSGFARRRMQQRIAAKEAQHTDFHPTIAQLLEVDAEYRRQAAGGKLKMITPKRFNPRNETWLPVLHTEHGDWSYTALFSNTARAHELGKTHDWVVVFFENKGHEG